MNRGRNRPAGRQNWLTDRVPPWRQYTGTFSSYAGRAAAARGEQQAHAGVAHKTNSMEHQAAAQRAACAHRERLASATVVGGQGVVHLCKQGQGGSKCSALLACCKTGQCYEASRGPCPETTTGSTRWLAALLQLACAPGWALCDQPAAAAQLRRAPHMACTLRHTLHANLRHRSHAPKPLARGQAQGQVVVAHGGSHVDPELNGGVEGRGHACPVSLPVGRLGRASGQRSPISLNARLRFCPPLPTVR